jgi:hypothetical protein
MADEISYIEIEKDNIPYNFDITLDEKTYTFDIKYNAQYDFFTVDLYLQSTGEALIFGEKIVYGNSLFSTVIEEINSKYVIIPKNLKFPKIAILPYDLSNKETRITYDNLGVTTFLFLKSEGDLNE